MGMEGHIIAVEADHGARIWRTFDATSPVTGALIARKATEYITRLSKEGTLSDIDCGTGCPCLTPIDGCEGCEAASAYGYVHACMECRDDYVAYTAQPTRPKPEGMCECGDPWCADDHRDTSDAMREAFAGESRN
jgi:hypothetical protein